MKPLPVKYETVTAKTADIRKLIPLYHMYEILNTGLIAKGNEVTLSFISKKSNIN